MPALSTVIALVRDTTLDEDAAAYRVTDAKLITYANDFLREAILLRPDLFSTIGEIPCTNDTVLQAVPAGSLVLVDIFQVKTGRIVREILRKDLDGFNSTWMSDTAAPAKNWIRHDKDPGKFFIYPKAPTSQILIGQTAALPTLFAATSDTIPTTLPTAYYSAMHHYMVFRCEARDDEAVLAGRAKLFYDGFAALMGKGGATKMEAEQPEKPRG